MNDCVSIGSCLNVNQIQGTRPRPGSAGKVLASSWPSTYRACVETYFARVNFVLVNSAGQCDAGYILAAVLAMQSKYQELHSHRPVSQGALDSAAAREIRYHWDRQHKFQRPTAALWKCLLNLVVERPERFR